GAGLAPNPATKARPANLVFGEDCDVSSAGRIYVADRGANAVLVFSLDGALVETIRVNAPVSVASLPEGEVAVRTLRGPPLVMVVWDESGREPREFGDPEAIAEGEGLNCFLTSGRLSPDATGHLSYAFESRPEPTIRQYDRYGYSAGQDIQYTSLDAFPEARA